MDDRRRVNIRNLFSRGMMYKFILLIFTIAATAAAAAAHEPFSLVSSERKSITAAELTDLEAQQTMGQKADGTLRFSRNEIRLVVTTGPEDDMLSYRIQGVRNPVLVVPSGAVLRILFVNSDHDMRHDIRFGHRNPPFELAPALEMTAGTERLTARSGENVFQGEDIVLRAVSNGNYTYFCSVRGHAAGGMWGNIAVGVEPVPAPTQATDPHAGHGATPAATPSPHDHAGHGATPTPTPTPHVHAGHDALPSPTPTPQDHTGHGAPAGGHDQHSAHRDAEMSSTVDIGDPMSREGSGTSWLPDSSPTYAYMKMYEDGGMFMLMGTGFLRYTQIGSTRDVSVAGKGGRSRVSAPTMFHAMYSRPLSERSQLGVRVMASLDPIIERGWGYPLLYQSGETYGGLPMHDRQHPHDFISELAATYSYKVNDRQSFFVYGGIVGEPALGAPMFMHRHSGMNNPDAPISHHWQDASHITWGVITGGYNFGKFKIEGSVFNGTEPDENRWAFDKLQLNSVSGRFSFNPTANWAFQVSHGYLKRPERAEPDLDHLHRTTASALYNKPLSGGRNFAASFVWGQNFKEEKATNSYLFEADYTFGKNSIFGRMEQVQKDGHELVIPHSDPIHDDVFVVGTYALGYVRDIVKGKGMDVGIGGMATFGTNPSALTPYYGGTRHGGWQIFLRFRPSSVRH
jgi:hypothetical protein